MPLSSVLPVFPTHLKTTITSHTGPVHCVAFSSASGQYILSGSSDRSIHLSNPTKPPSHNNPQNNNQHLIQTYTGAHVHPVLDLAVAPDNATFASVGGDKLVFLWDVSQARTVRRWSGHFGRVECVAFAGQDHGGGASLVISGSYDASVRVWDVRSSSTKAVQVLEEAGDSVSAVLVPSSSSSSSSSGGDKGGGGGWEIVSGSVDGRVRTYDVRMGILTTDVIGPPITSLAATRDGGAVLVSALDDSVRLMDRAGGKGGEMLKRYVDPGGFRNRELRIRSCLGMGDALVVSGGEDGGVYAWDLVEGKVVGKVEKAHGGKVASAVAWNGVDGRRREWASGGMDGMVRVWGAES